MTKINKLTEQKINDAIVILRGKRIIMDADLADFYNVSTKALNQAVKRNIHRFPDEFMFQLNKKEKEYVVTNCDHLKKLKFSPYLPYAFTEHGAVMAATILNSEVAVQASIQVVRVFINVSNFIAAHKELADKIEKLEHGLKVHLNKHDSELKILFEAIRKLMQPPNPPRKRIGFKKDD